MAAPSVVTGTVQAKLYVKTKASAFSTPADFAAAKAALATTANLSNNTTAFGPISKSGNPVEYTPFGEEVTKSIAGAASLSEISFTVTIIESDTLHSSLLVASVGKFIEVGLVKTKGSNEVMYYARGEVSGSEQTFDTPNELTITIALAESPSRFA